MPRIFRILCLASETNVFALSSSRNSVKYPSYTENLKPAQGKKKEEQRKETTRRTGLPEML